MSHDIEASWAGTEIARVLAANPGLCFASPPRPIDVSTYAGREGRTNWPHADGLVEVSVASSRSTYSVAIEYKRANEGLHGILTGLGQAHAYLRKGYAGSIIIVPRRYAGLPDSGTYARDVLDHTSQARSIGVFVYDAPDRSKVSPFDGLLTAARPFILDGESPSIAPRTLGRPETQWVHVREGSSEPDAYYRYLQAVKLVSGDDHIEPPFSPPRELRSAVQRQGAGVDPSWFLSFTSTDSMHDRAWRYFWFKNVLTEDMMIGWRRNAAGEYEVNHVSSRIQRSDGAGLKQFFSGRSDSIKNKTVSNLNEGAISELAAWNDLAENFHNRAHSYREDIDSGLERIGFLDQDGRMTESGYRFLDACEKSGDPNTGLPRTLLSRALLDVGGLGTFLHYVYKLSDEVFSEDPFAFTNEQQRSGRPVLRFNQEEYLLWIEDALANRLRVLRKVSPRGGQTRKPFQAELALLRGFGLVAQGYRIGVGLPVNWPEVQKTLELGS